MRRQWLADSGLHLVYSRTGSDILCSQHQPYDTVTAPTCAAYRQISGETLLYNLERPWSYISCLNLELSAYNLVSETAH